MKASARSPAPRYQPAGQMPARPPALDFQRHVRPILADKCASSATDPRLRADLGGEVRGRSDASAAVERIEIG
jgi:hypothetical protein